jgi:hypothetical protein
MNARRYPSQRPILSLSKQAHEVAERHEGALLERGEFAFERAIALPQLLE